MKSLLLLHQTEGRCIMNTCDYSGIAKYYEKWCRGDHSYLLVASFYRHYLSQYTGIFAELGVGTGRIAIPVSRQENVKVYGIDICEEMLQECEKGRTSDADLSLLRADFRDFVLPQRADIIYMPFRTIGHMMTKADLESCFHCVQCNLKEGGLFIFDHYMFSREWAEAHNDIEIPMYEEDGLKITDRYRYDFFNNIMHCNIAVNESTVTRFDFRWIDVDEIKDVYPQYSFCCEKLMGSFSGSVWTPESSDQIWVLRRTG